MRYRFQSCGVRKSDVQNVRCQGHGLKFIWFNGLVVSILMGYGSSFKDLVDSGLTLQDKT